MRGFETFSEFQKIGKAKDQTRMMPNEYRLAGGAMWQSMEPSKNDARVLGIDVNKAAYQEEALPSPWFPQVSDPQRGMQGDQAGNGVG